MHRTRLGSLALLLFTALCIALAVASFLPLTAHAQETGPQPTTLHAPSTFRSKTARATFYRDSLRAEYPLNASGLACWKFTEPDSVVGHDRLWCHRDGIDLAYSKPSTTDVVSRGNLATFFRGKWLNYQSDNIGGVIVLSDGTRYRLPICKQR